MGPPGNLLWEEYAWNSALRFLKSAHFLMWSYPANNHNISISHSLFCSTGQLFHETLLDEECALYTCRILSKFGPKPATERNFCNPIAKVLMGGDDMVRFLSTGGSLRVLILYRVFYRYISTVCSVHTNHVSISQEYCTSKILCLIPKTTVTSLSVFMDTSVFLWYARWRHGRSRGETKYSRSVLYICSRIMPIYHKFSPIVDRPDCG